MPNSQDPTMQLATKWGTVTLTFTDDTRTGRWDDYNKVRQDNYVVTVRGAIKINGKTYTLNHVPYNYLNRWYRAGVELDRPERYFGKVHYHSYISEAVTAVASKIISDGAFSEAIREAYESRPDLQHAAKRQTWADRVESARAKVEQVRRELADAEELERLALRALESFDAGVSVDDATRARLYPENRR
jgi:hypothetical protein